MAPASPSKQLPQPLIVRLDKGDAVAANYRVQMFYTECTCFRFYA